MARGTPFHPRTQALCSSMRWKEWAGYFVVNAFDTFHDPEYHAVRSGAALIDVSPLYKYNFVGPDATALTDRLITRNVKRSRVGQVLYSGWCDERGKLLQDGCFQRFAKDFVRATAVDPALVWFERVAAGMNVEIEDVSEELGALALQGADVVPDPEHARGPGPFGPGFLPAPGGESGRDPGGGHPHRIHR